MMAAVDEATLERFEPVAASDPSLAIDEGDDAGVRRSPDA
jgi:hypothetical protein